MRFVHDTARVSECRPTTWWFGRVYLRGTNRTVPIGWYWRHGLDLVMLMGRRGYHRYVTGTP